MLISKIHHKQGKTILASCDRELLGRKFSSGKLQLDLGSDFYAGKPMSDSEFIESASNADIINLVGERAVGLALEAGLISKNHIIKIAGIPHAQAFILH